MKKQRYAEGFLSTTVKLFPGKSDESSDGNTFASNLEVLKRRISEQTADADASKSTIGSDVDMVETEIAKLRNLRRSHIMGGIRMYVTRSCFPDRKPTFGFVD